jgi:hypothetical protein
MGAPMSCHVFNSVEVSCVEFIRVSMWFLVLASVGVYLLFGCLLGLASVSVVCCYRFSLSFFLKTGHSLLNE